jgi:hypothetical protein
MAARRLERWDTLLRQARDLPRFGFIAEYLVYMTKRKADRRIVEGWQVKHSDSGFVALHPVYAPPGGYYFRDPHALYEFARRRPLNDYVRQAEYLRADVLEAVRACCG